jgi:hypothetical protein
MASTRVRDIQFELIDPREEHVGELLSEYITLESLGRAGNRKRTEESTVWFRDWRGDSTDPSMVFFNIERDAALTHLLEFFE